MKKLMKLFEEKPWWERTTKEIDKENKQIKWMFRGLVAFGVILVIFMMFNGLFILFNN